MATTPFPVSPELTAIAVAYRNAAYIADEVLPRVPVATKEFSYLKYALGDAFTAPDTRVGPKGQPNQVDWLATSTPAKVEDHALDAPVTNDALEQWQRARAAGNTQMVDPRMRATRLVHNLVALKREQRAASLVFSLASYATANKVTLSGANQWSDYAGSDPHYAIMTALDGAIQRPNVAVLGRAVMTKLSMHPKIKGSIYGQVTGNQAAVTQQALAALLEVDRVVVGAAYINSAAKGQAPTLVRLCGNDAAFLCIDADADTEQGVTFGYTAQFGERVAGEIADPDIGMRGGVRIRSGESVGEFVTAPDLGYLFKNAVA